MIESVYKIGKSIDKFNEKAYAKEYDDNIKADYVITIDFDKNGIFQKVDQEQFSKDKLPKYFYKKAKGSNPPSYSPTLYLNKKDVSKTLKNLQKILEKIKKVNLENAQEKEIINNIIKDLQQKSKDLEEEIKKMSGDKDILTIRIDDQYVGEIDFLRKAIVEIDLDEGKDSLGNGVCSLCLEKKEVSGNISPFKFYTIDKPGYITGGFDQKNAYKNFPLCYDCKRYIKLGKEKIKSELGFWIGKKEKNKEEKILKYYIIPDFVVGSGDDNEIRKIGNIVNTLSTFVNKTLKLDSDKDELLDVNKIVDVNKIDLKSDEYEILDVISNVSEIKKLMSEDQDLDAIPEKSKDVIKGKDIIVYNFLFLEDKNSAEIINLYIQDIYPSRLKEMFESKYVVEKIRNLRKPLIKKTESEESLDKITDETEETYKKFNYYVMSKFFSDNKKYFLELLDKTFRSVRVDEKLLIYFLLKRIRDSFKSDNSDNKQYSQVIQDAYSIFLFVKLTTKEVNMKEENIEKIENAESIKEFLESLPTLDSPAKRALFLMGVLTEHVLWAQYKDKKTKSFMKKLKGLRMNVSDVMGLLPEIRNKLEEYDEYSPNLAKIFLEASKNLLEENTLEKMSIEELNFYFVLGMGMYNAVGEKFIFAKKEENHEKQA